MSNQTSLISLPKSFEHKYRPKKIDDFIFHDEGHKSLLCKYIEDGFFPNSLLFSGPAGTGKTTIARILGRLVDRADFKEIRASRDTGVQQFRDDVELFAASCPHNSPYKIILLDEADGLSSAAKKLLRGFIQDHSQNCRFIFTCNTLSAITTPLRSRTTHFVFKQPSNDQILKYMVDILIKENVIMDENVIQYVLEYIKLYYPDIRKILSTIENNIIDGKLLSPSFIEDSSSEFNEEFLSLLYKKDIRNLITLVKKSLTDDEYEEVFSLIYNHVDKIPNIQQFQIDSIIVLTASHLEKHINFGIPEINVVSLLIKIMGILNE